MWELLYINDRSIQSTRFFDVPLPVCTLRDPGRGRDRGGFRQDPGPWDTNTRSEENTLRGSLPPKQFRLLSVVDQF